jgi:hypothetical protein
MRIKKKTVQAFKKRILGPNETNRLEGFQNIDSDLDVPEVVPQGDLERELLDLACGLGEVSPRFSSRERLRCAAAGSPPEREKARQRARQRGAPRDRENFPRCAPQAGWLPTAKSGRQQACS